MQLTQRCNVIVLFRPTFTSTLVVAFAKHPIASQISLLLLCGICFGSTKYSVLYKNYRSPLLHDLNFTGAAWAIHRNSNTAIFLSSSTVLNTHNIIPFVCWFIFNIRTADGIILYSRAISAGIIIARDFLSFERENQTGIGVNELVRKTGTTDRQRIINYIHDLERAKIIETKSSSSHRQKKIKNSLI
jgi:hypothetical protein